MDLFTKVYTSIKIVLAIAAIVGGFIFMHIIETKLSGGVNSAQIQAMMDAQNRTFQQIADNIVRANTTVSDQKLQDEVSKLDSKITKSINKSNEKIDQIGNIVASQKQIAVLNTASTKTYKAGTTNPNSYLFKKIYAKDTNGKEYPVAQVMYYPNRSVDQQWKFGTYPLDYKLTVVQTLQKSGTINNYAEAVVENNQMKETKGKQFPIKITSAQFVQKEPYGKSFMWVPAFDMGTIGTSNGDFGAMANVSFFGYGKTVKDLDQRFISAGIGGNDSNEQLEFSPAMQNVGNYIPLMSNMWLAPYFTFDKHMIMGGGFGLSVRF